MAEATHSRLSKTALIAFVLGLSSLPLSLVSALPALYLGVQAIRGINCEEGRLHGLRLAIAALVLSAVSTAITLLGLLALVLLVVQEKSHIAGCTNNLRQIGQAINRYRDLHDHYFPPATVLNPSLKPPQRLSWEAAVLSHLSEGGATGKKWEKLAGGIDFKEAWDAPANAGLRWNVAPYFCPMFAHELLPNQVGLTSYVGIAGVGTDAATLPLTDTNAGFFGYDRRIRDEHIPARLDATMIAAETTQANGPWLAGGPPTVRGVRADETHFIGKGADFGGLHRGGANVLWADGSVHIVTEKINPELFRFEARLSR
jgi:prepilin-type processing-associated H-X9-DG protein